MLGYNDAQRDILFRERKRAEAEMDIRNTTQRLADVQLQQSMEQQENQEEESEEETENVENGNADTSRTTMVQKQSE